MKISKMGVPCRFTAWLSWFINHTARVLVNLSIGLSRTFKGRSAPGLHPLRLLFTIYINDLQAEFEKDTFVTAYADDLLMARSSLNKDVIVASLHPEVDKVVAWSDKARLTVN